MWNKLSLVLSEGAGDVAPPSGIAEVLENLVFSIVTNPVDALLNANYIGAAATEYTIRNAGDRHRYDILGKDSPTYNLTFEAR